MTLSLTVLGSSGTFAGPGQACSGYLLRSDTTTVVMDCGPGTLANLQEHVPLTAVDAFIVSHSHPDHWLEIPVLNNALRYVFGRRDVPLYSTAETLSLADKMCHQLTWTFRPDVITDGSELHIGDMRIRCSRTDHPPETLGLRVDVDGRSLGYSADTGPGWTLAEFGPGLDVGINDATYLDSDLGPTPVHTTAGQAGAGARGAGVGRLLITHVLPTVSVEAAEAEASDAYGAPVEAAKVNRTYAA